MVVEIETCIQFHQQFSSSYCTNFLSHKSYTTQTVCTEKLRYTHLFRKAARKYCCIWHLISIILAVIFWIDSVRTFPILEAEAGLVTLSDPMAVGINDVEMRKNLRSTYKNTCLWGSATNSRKVETEKESTPRLRNSRKYFDIFFKKSNLQGCQMYNKNNLNMCKMNLFNYMNIF